MPSHDLASPSAPSLLGGSPSTSRRGLALQPAVRSGRLSPRTAFYLQASLVASFLAGSSAPTPLYARYQSVWGFSPVTVTVVFGVYALAVLTSLLTVGSLSDYVGRRPVLLVATAAQAATMLVFITAGGLPSLLVARILQGLSTGSAMGALGAGMLDIDKAKGTIANAVGPMLGTATGALASGLMVRFLPAPTRLVYAGLFVVFAVQGLGVALMAESSPRQPGALASLKPHFRVPPAVRGPLLVAIPALVASWSLAGFYGSLAPTLFRRMTGASSPILCGLALFALAAPGVVAVVILRTRPPRTLMAFGTAALALGVGTVLLAVSRASVPIFFLGSIVAGMGFGTGFQGAIRTVIPLAAPHERAGVLSVLYLVSYLAMGLPAVLAGLRVVYGGGILATAREYGAVLITLSVFALIGTLSRRPARSA